MADQDVILAFSGGLDTSFCVPWLREQGFDNVVTVFVDTGGVSEEERAYIEGRADEVGAKRHYTIDAGEDLWNEFVVPLAWSGARYQNQYPMLCSDRYVIVRKCLELARELGTRHFAHGCTGMGNDQLRFDQTVRSLGDFEIHAPIRDIQTKAEGGVRAWEQRYLGDRGYSVRAKTGRYTINENILGVTISGSEIDEWEAPGPETWQLTRPRAEWPDRPTRASIEFEQGVATAIDGKRMSGPATLRELNHRFGACGVGRHVYTGDSSVGLKGRIVFESPGLDALMTAHDALEEAVNTKWQNSFRPIVAQRWAELVYTGFFYEPGKRDLEAYLQSSQEFVTGEVEIESHGGSVHAIAVQSEHILRSRGATYAQSADWTAEEAVGFIKLTGQSSSLSARINPIHRL